MSNRPTATLDRTQMDGAGSVSAWILTTVIDPMDALGAADWDYRYVTLVSAMVMGAIRLLFGQYKGIDWYALVHAILSGYLSLACVWLDTFAAYPLTGTSEPLRSILCQGPLTSLHRIVPAITMGYGIFDILEGFSHGVDFLLHGVATFTIMGYFCHYDVGEIIVPFLLMEISTLHLCFMRAPFLSETLLALNMAMFVLTFFMFRIVICPYYWYDLVVTLSEQQQQQEKQQTGGAEDDAMSCLPWHFFYVVFAFGMFFNCLNTFWFYKIIRKAMRKMSGTEKITDKNDLKDKDK